MKYILTIILLLFFSIFLLFSETVINVYPTGKMQASGLYIKKGDLLKFEVSGEWTLWDKYKPVGGEGHQFVANEYGNWGTLLGKIGNGGVFLIGKGKEITSRDEGVLYLFPNKGVYKAENQSGNLSVKINGGLPINDFKNQLIASGVQISFNPKDKVIITDLFVESGDKIEIYAFGEWTMWDGIYQEVGPGGHEFNSNGIPWGKLYGGIGTSYGEFTEIFPIGEKTQLVVTKSGIISLFPYLDNYISNEKGNLEIFIKGARKASSTDKEKIDKYIKLQIEVQVLSKINEIRTIASLPRVEIDPILSQSASDHAKYLILNNKFTRDENSSDINFTGATLEERLNNLGYKRPSKEMFCQTENAIDSLDLFMNTVYHRLRLLNPDLKYLGYGTYKSKDKEIHVFDFGYLNENEEKLRWDAIFYPANNATEIKMSWSGEENPDPLPLGAQKPLGSPISIVFKEKINSVLKVELIDEAGNKINSFIITPMNDINNKDFNAVIIVPKEVLKNNNKYIVIVKANLGKDNIEKDYSWSFITELEKKNK